MILLALFLLQADSDGEVARGAKVFAQSCAVGYCHGTAGAANRGPRLAGRGFDRAFVDRVIHGGVPGTAMPAFKTMNAADLKSVIAYVMNISGGGAGAAVNAAPAHVPSPEPPRFAGPPAAKKGKDLFFDAARGTRCSTCHAVEDWGIAVGPNLTAKAPSSAAIRSVKTTAAKIAVTQAGEKFPALLVDRNAQRIQLYDLTTAPPVLRTFAPAEVTLQSGTNWNHSSVTKPYTDADLESIAAYLQWVASKP